MYLRSLAAIYPALTSLRPTFIASPELLEWLQAHNLHHYKGYERAYDESGNEGIIEAILRLERAWGKLKHAVARFSAGGGDYDALVRELAECIA